MECGGKAYSFLVLTVLGVVKLLGFRHLEDRSNDGFCLCFNFALLRLWLLW